MSNKMLIDGTALTMDNVQYTKPKINQSGGKNVTVLNAECKKTLCISTPLMLTWGVNENDFDGRGVKSYDLSLQFPRDQDSNYSENTEKLLANLEEFENKIKNDAVENSKEWFNKGKMTLEQVDVLWTPMLKYPKDQETQEPDKTRKPTLRVKIPFYENTFKIELYNTERERIFPNLENQHLLPMNLIEKGQNIAVVIQCGGIWFANGKFGTTWRLVQAIVQPRASLMGQCHINLSPSETERMKTEVTKPDEEEEEANTTMVEDSDHEDVSEDVPGVAEHKEEEVVEPEPVKKRKPIKKKKTDE